MATDRLRHLDVGGLDYGNLNGVVFLGLARTFSSEDFYIVDTKVKEDVINDLPPNLHVTSPKVLNIPFPLLYMYKLEYPSNYFADARMDLTLDFLPLDMLIKVFWEIKRCLKPESNLTVVDEVGNRSLARTAARLTGLQQTSIFNTEELLRSEYPLSQYAYAFLNGGLELFGLQFQKKPKKNRR